MADGDKITIDPTNWDDSIKWATEKRNEKLFKGAIKKTDEKQKRG